MVTNPSKSMKKIKKSENDSASLIYVRNLKARDNDMLRKLKEFTGFKSNAKNVLLAGYKVLEQRDLIKKLQNEVRKLERKVEEYDDRFDFIRQETLHIIQAENKSIARRVKLEKEIDKLKKRFIQDLKKKIKNVPRRTAKSNLLDYNPRFHNQDHDDYDYDED